MQNSDYRDVWGISQSAIKDFQFKSPKRWKEVWIDKKLDTDKNEDNFTMGSLIDTILFSPDLLDKRFYIGEEKLPSKAVAAIIRDYYHCVLKQRDELMAVSQDLPEVVEPYSLTMEDNGILLQCANRYCFKDGDDDKCGWQSSWKDDTRVKSLTEKGLDYFESLKAAGGRKVISHAMNVEALDLRDILYKDPTVRDYFVPSEDNDLLFQLELYTTWQLPDGSSIPLKGALDIVRFNHRDKTARIIDFKSSYSAFNFVSSIKQFGYCDQLSFYDYLLREWMLEACDGKFCDYKIVAPLNIVIDINDRVPYIYEYDWRDISLAADGNKAFLYHLHGTHDHNSRIKRGWKKLLDEIGWHWQKNLWDKPKELYENKVIKVNLLTC